MKVKGKMERNFHLDKRGVSQATLLIFKEYGNRFLRFLKEYPPQRNPETRYVRGYGQRGGRRTSEDLGARWNSKIKKISGGVTMDIGNNASYAQWVQARGRQAQIHLGWWQTEMDAVDEFYEPMRNKLMEVLPRFVVRQGKGK